MNIRAYETAQQEFARIQREVAQLESEIADKQALLRRRLFALNMARTALIDMRASRTA